MDEPTTITPEEARERFGELRVGPAKAHREFETPEGLWRPEFGPRLTLKGYKLHRVRKAPYRPRGWPKR